jgi:hypothetical protein
MTAPHADQLIEGYLARIAAAAADFPAAARNELLDDMRAHIAEARSRESDETDAAILNILDRLGEPSVVVNEARDRLGLRREAPVRPGLVEIAAVVLLPFVWIAGVILLWWSPAWKTRDKILATIASLGGYPTVLILILLTGHVVAFSTGSCTSVSDSTGAIISNVCTGPSILDVIGIIVRLVAMIGLYLLPVLTSVYLIIRLRVGRRLERVAAT